MKAHIESLKAELATAQTRTCAVEAQLAQRDVEHAAQIAAIEARLREETARADQAMVDLAGERAARRAEAKLAEMRDDDVTILREDHAAQLAQRDSELAAARAAADKATAELVELARRLATLAESWKVNDAEAAPEPPRRGRLARGWAWLLRN
jgi:hypothetical protein